MKLQDLLKRALVGFLPFVFTVGCLMLHIPPPEVEVQEKELPLLHLGVTTRDEVLSRLGFPNILNRKLASVYEWRTRQGIGILFVPGGGYANFSGSNKSRLLVEFDDVGKVSHFAFAEYHNPGVYIQEPSPSYFIDGSAHKPQKLAEPLLQPSHSQIRGHNKPWIALTISRDGRYAAGSLDGGMIQVVDLKTKKDRMFASGIKSWGLFLPRMLARVIDISQDGKTLAATPIADTTVLWDMSSGERLQVLRGHGKETWTAIAGPTVVKFAPDGSTVATGGYDGMVKLWDVTSGKATSSYRIADAKIQSLAFSPQGDLLAVGTSRGDIVVIGLKAGDQARLVKGSDALEHGRSVTFSPSGRMLVANNCIDIELWRSGDIREQIGRRASADKPVPVDMPQEPEAVLLLPYGESGADCWPILALSPDENVLIATSNENLISLWDVTMRRLLTVWKPSAITGELALTLGPEAALFVYYDSGIRLNNMENPGIRIIDLAPIINESME